MKKPVVTALGVAGACAACCAIPLAIPLMGGLSVAGLTTLIDWACLDVGGEMLAIGAGVAAAVVVGLGIWAMRRWRRQTTSCATEADTSCACPKGVNQ